MGKTKSTSTKAHFSAQPLPLHSPLVNDLARAIRKPDPIHEPYVIRNEVSAGKSVHFLVIWDKWRDLDKQTRSKILLDALEKVDPSTASKVTIALGVTQDEAFRMGYLPYAIVSLRRDSDPVSQADLNTALQQAGGVEIKVGTAMQRRYPTLEGAQNAYRIVSLAVNGPFWTIERETRSE